MTAVRYTDSIIKVDLVDLDILRVVQEEVLSLERAHADHVTYREALQELDKWILQTSFRLMSHNALCVGTKEHAQTEIQKHQVGGGGPV